MSDRKKVLTLEDFEEFLRDYPIEGPTEYPLSEATLNKFFEYVKEKNVTDGIGKTERTFQNRLTCTMGDFRKKLAEEPLSSKFKNECWKNDFFIKDFLKVLRIFHGTKYYKELELRKHA